MKEIKLSERLLRIAQYIPKGTKIADIGSDHALLPCYLIINGISPFAVAGEVNEGPYRAAERQVKNLKIQDQISVRKGDGLSVVQENEVDLITIAGMGGTLIKEILEKGKNRLNHIQRLILQPNVGSESVRKWLDDHRWDLIAEDILEEEEKIYEIIVAEPRKNAEDPAYASLTKNKEELYLLGPILWKNKNDVMLKKWKKELGKNEYILQQLEYSLNQDEKEKKKEQLRIEKKWLTEVISCLQKDRRSSKSLNN